MENPTETGALGRIPIKPENAILRSTLVARSARNESYFQLNIHTMERVTKLGERGANLHHLSTGSNAVSGEVR